MDGFIIYNVEMRDAEWTALLMIENLKEFNKNEKYWEIFKTTVKWTEESRTRKGHYKIGAQIKSDNKSKNSLKNEKNFLKSKPSAEDLFFFKNTKLLKSIPREAVCPLLNSITLQRISSGQCREKWRIDDRCPTA